MTDVTPGVYTVGELLAMVDFDAEQETSVDYNDSGYDFRRVQVGGLPFDSLDDTLRVPEAAETVEVTLDQSVVATLNVVSEDNEDEDN